MKRVGFFATAAASAATALLLTRGDDGWGVFLLWASSLALAGWSLRGPAPAAAPILPQPADALVLLGIIAVSAGARLYRIEQLPFGLWIDELWTAHNAARLGAQPGFHPFGATPLLGYMPAWVQTSNLYLYACWIIESVLGFSRFGAKMISVVPAVLAAPLLYMLARQFFGLWPSLLASFLFAVSSWHVTLSRWGWDQVCVTTLWIAVFLLLELGLRRGDRVLHFLSGVCLGLALYAYVGARLGVVAVGALLLVTLAQRRNRETLEATGSLVLGFLLTTLPLAIFWLAHPASFSVRSSSVSILPRLAAGDLHALANNALRYALMFHVEGDANPRHQLPFDPQLDPLSGTLFVVGVALCFASWRERRSQMIGLWFAAALAGGLFTSDAPHAYRTGTAAPACFLFVAQALHTGIEALRKRSPGLLRPTLVAFGIASLAIAAWNAHGYFVTRARSRICWESTWGGAPALLIFERFRTLHGPSRHAYFDWRLKTFELESEFRFAFGSFGDRDPDGYLARVRDSAGVFWLGDGDMDRIRSFSASAIYFLKPEAHDAYAARIPGLHFQPIQNPFGATVALMASRDPLAWTADSP